jgi:hypothetical protein
MSSRTFRRVARGILTAGLVVALASALGPMSGALPSASAQPKKSVDEAVALALSLAAGPVAFLDDSSVTDCMGSSPVPLVYRNDRIVLRSDDTKKNIRNAVTHALADVGSPGTVSNIEVIDLPPPPSSKDGQEIVPIVVVSFDTHDGPVHIVDVARRLRQIPIPTSPDYLFSVSSGPTGMWPNGFPTPTSDVEPTRDPALGDKVRIWVYDTGLPPAAQGARAPHLSKLTKVDNETLDARKPSGVVDLYYGGHTLAIGDVMATMAPGAIVKAARITDQMGIATDSTAARRMAATLKKANAKDQWPDLIVNAFGSPACLVDASVPGVDMPPLGLRAVSESVDQHAEALMIVSAGNRSTDRPFYPAAFDTDATSDSVIGVGSLNATEDADGDAWSSASRSAPLSWFSNYGSWVELYAPGESLSTRHVINLRFQPKAPLIMGQAIVSGTSFAGPYVAAEIAEVMASNGLDPYAALDLLKAAGTKCSSGVGGGIAVALTAMSASATDPADSGLPSEC